LQSFNFPQKTSLPQATSSATLHIICPKGKHHLLCDLFPAGNLIAAGNFIKPCFISFARQGKHHLHSDYFIWMVRFSFAVLHEATSRTRMQEQRLSRFL
jgi:hypothetical protein